MRIVTGQAVRGSDFFERPDLINKLWRKLDTNTSVIISAPRRVGKTSLMRYIEDNPKENYDVIYIITEPVETENNYYKEIIKGIMDSSFIKRNNKMFLKIGQKFPDILGSFSHIGMDGITLKDANVNYYEKLIELIDNIDLDGHKLVIMIDEFAQTIQNIKEKDNGMQNAIHLLQSNRALRQNSKINSKCQFIYTGSISLESIARRMNSSKYINDLDIVKVPPLNIIKGEEFVKELLKGLEFTIEDNTIKYMLNEIKWLNLLYIQLTIDKLQDIYYETEIKVMDQKIVFDAISRIVNEDNKFRNWHERLKVYEGNELKFIMEVLTTASEAEVKSITSNGIYDLAVKYTLEEKYKEIIQDLIDDGYIDTTCDGKIYSFTSPILRMWWWKNFGK